MNFSPFHSQDCSRPANIKLNYVCIGPASRDSQYQFSENCSKPPKPKKSLLNNESKTEIIVIGPLKLIEMIQTPQKRYDPLTHITDHIRRKRSAQANASTLSKCYIYK